MSASVDVIILSWNRTEDTLAAIDSALAQRNVEKRVLIVDQGSTADNLARLKSHVRGHPEVELRLLESNIGVPGGRNLASALGNAPYIVALDNDAVFADEHVLERLVARMEAEPHLGAIAFRILNFFTGRDDPMCWDYPEAMRPLAGAEFDTTRFIGAGHAIRRAAFDDAGGYDDALFFGGEERDLAYRILNLGYGIRYAADFTVLHKSDPEARVRWDAGRYYYAVRNALYTDFKYGASWPRLARAAAALSVKGMRNGIPGQALRGVRDAVRMAFAYTHSSRKRAVDQISPMVRSYIDGCERVGRGSLWQRIGRQFSRLPGSS